MYVHKFKVHGLIILMVGVLGGCFSDGDKKKEKEEYNYSLEHVLKQENVVPVAIIGSGPAGLSSALYIARAGFKAFVFAGPTPCGQLTQTTFIENWPGRFRVLGAELMNDLKEQAKSFGACIISDTVKNIDTSSWPFAITTEEGRQFKAMSVILATGAKPKTLDIEGEQKYWGKGVTTCAVCDAPFFKKKNVVIIGGGDTAVEQVFELAPYAKHVTVFVRKDFMRAAKSGQRRIKEFDNVTIEYNKEVKKIYGNDEHVQAIDVWDNKEKTLKKRDIDGVFLAIGHIPRTELVKDALELDSHGYVVMQGRTQETSVQGIYAAGEVQDTMYRQAGVAAGEGIKAALDATSFLYELGFSSKIGEKLDKKFFETFSDERLKLKDISTVEELHEYVLKEEGLVMLDFYAMYCPGCIKMIPVLESVAHKMQDKLKVVKCNHQHARAILKELYFKQGGIRVSKIPALLVFKDGKFLDMNTSVMSRTQVMEYASKFLDEK